LGQNPFPEWHSQRKEKKMARFGTIPAISGEAMAEVDRIMMQDLGVDTLQLMELAGYGVADAIRRHAGLDLGTQSRLLALVGTGGNGGDAMVAARLLSAWGTDATVVLVKPRSGYIGIAAHQMAILDRMDIPVLEPDTVTSLPAADLIIDGLLGFSLKGDPRGEAERLSGTGRGDRLAVRSGRDLRPRRRAVHPRSNDRHPCPAKDRALVCCGGDYRRDLARRYRRSASSLCAHGCHGASGHLL
jgi:NAD(P)H-hydrate repair Nnr-like enzyme with NAD(P)H-hydrate epimerase domain